MTSPTFERVLFVILTLQIPIEFAAKLVMGVAEESV